MAYQAPRNALMSSPPTSAPTSPSPSPSPSPSSSPTTVDIQGPSTSNFQNIAAASTTDKRKKILIGAGVATLVLGGVGAAVVITQMNKSSSSSSSSSSGEYARGYMPPTDAEAQVASLNRATYVSRVVAALPDTLDWRTVPNVISPIKNQGGCGSCWAFSATDTMQGNYGLKYQKSVVLSPEQLVDCDLRNGGCNGGWMMTAWQQYYGKNTKPYAMTEQQYPYALTNPNGAQRLQCRAGDGSSGPLTVTGTTVVLRAQQWSQQAEDTVAGFIAQNGPVAIAVDATGWERYRGGIGTSRSIGCGTGLNHAVQLIGYGVENGQKYWLIRNQWGTSWGEQGYMRLARGANTCGVLQDISHVTVAAVGGGPTASPPNTPTSLPSTRSPVSPTTTRSPVLPTTNPPPSAASTLRARYALYAGYQLVSPDKSHTLIMQTDGNLVLYRSGGTATWATNTFGTGNYVWMQEDCNLGLYNSANQMIWSSKSTKTGDSACAQSYLTVQNDGNVVIYKSTSTQAVWATNTQDNKPVAPTTSSPNTLKPRPASLTVSSLGCLKDSTPTRLFPDRLSAASNSLLSDCAFLAYGAGYSYFGLENGGECWAGGKNGDTSFQYNKYGVATNCNMACTGDSSSTRMCGGAWALTAYKIMTANVAITAPPTSDSEQALPLPVAQAGIRKSKKQCTYFNDEPSYCWQCTNNVDNLISCQEATSTAASQELVYPGLCPKRALQNAEKICNGTFDDEADASSSDSTNNGQ